MTAAEPAATSAQAGAESATPVSHHGGSSSSSSNHNSFPLYSTHCLSSSISPSCQPPQGTQPPSAVLRSRRGEPSQPAQPDPGRQGQEPQPGTTPPSQTSGRPRRKQTAHLPAPADPAQPLQEEGERNTTTPYSGPVTKRSRNSLQ